MCRCIKECVRSPGEWVASHSLFVGVVIFMLMVAFTWGIAHNWHSVKTWFGDSKTYYDVANFLYFITGFFTAILAVIAYTNFKLFNKTSSQSNLLQIDERWGSPEIIKARQIIHVLYRQVCDKVGYAKQNSGASLEKDVYPEVAQAIVQMSISKHKEIRNAFIYLLNYLEFMESLGFLYKNEAPERIAELEAFCGHTLVFNYGVFYSYIKYKNRKHSNDKNQKHKHNNDHIFFKEFKHLIENGIKEEKIINRVNEIQEYQKNSYEPTVYKNIKDELRKNRLFKELIKESKA